MDKKVVVYMCTIGYYLTIRRNAFESVLMRWMNLEPNKQSEGSQKEKSKYHILMNTYGIQRMVLMNLLAEQQWRPRQRGQTREHREGRRGWAE
jgi:hypothetical protein